MSGPTRYLPFLSAFEGTQLEEVGKAKLSGVPLCSSFFGGLLSDESGLLEKANFLLGREDYKEESWHQDAQYEGYQRRAWFSEGLGDPSTVSPTPYVQRQRFMQHSDAACVFEVRQAPSQPGPADYLVLVVSWTIAVDVEAAAGATAQGGVVVCRAGVYCCNSRHGGGGGLSKVVDPWRLGEKRALLERARLYFQAWVQEAQSLLNAQQKAPRKGLLGRLAHRTTADAVPQVDFPQVLQEGEQRVIYETDAAGGSSDQTGALVPGSTAYRSNSDSSDGEAPKLGLPEKPSWCRSQLLPVRRSSATMLSDKLQSNDSIPGLSHGEEGGDASGGAGSRGTHRGEHRIMSQLSSQRRTTAPPSSEPYQVVFYKQELGLQFESVFGVPVVAGVTGFDPGAPPQDGEGLAPAAEEEAQKTGNGNAQSAEEEAVPIDQGNPQDDGEGSTPDPASQQSETTEYILPRSATLSSFPGLNGSQSTMQLTAQERRRRVLSGIPAFSDEELDGGFVTLISPPTTRPPSVRASAVHLTDGSVVALRAQGGFDFSTLARVPGQLQSSTKSSAPRAKEAWPHITVGRLRFVESTKFNPACLEGSSDPASQQKVVEDPLALTAPKENPTEPADPQSLEGQGTQQGEGMEEPKDQPTNEQRSSPVDTAGSAKEDAQEDGLSELSFVEEICMPEEEEWDNQGAEPFLEEIQNTPETTLSSRDAPFPDESVKKEEEDRGETLPRASELSFVDEVVIPSEDQVSPEPNPNPFASPEPRALLKKEVLSDGQPVNASDLDSLFFEEHEAIGTEVDEDALSTEHVQHQQGSLAASWFSVECKDTFFAGDEPPLMIEIKTLLYFFEKMTPPDTLQTQDQVDTDTGSASLLNGGCQVYELHLSIDLQKGNFPPLERFQGLLHDQLNGNGLPTKPPRWKLKVQSQQGCMDTVDLDRGQWQHLQKCCEPTGLPPEGMWKVATLWIQVEGPLPVLPGSHSHVEPMVQQHQAGELGMETFAHEDLDSKAETAQFDDAEPSKMEDSNIDDSTMEDSLTKLESTESLKAGVKEVSEKSSSPRLPMIGAVVLAVNGVRTAGVGYEAVVALLRQPTRPLTVDLTDSWNSILDGIENRDRLTRRTVLKKIHHRAARTVKKKIDEFLEDFKNSNLRELMAGPPERGPNKMVWSLIYWVNQELIGLGLFDNRQYGGGLPTMGEKQFGDVLEHLERLIFERIFTFTLYSCPPGYRPQDHKLRDKMGSLRFLKPEHFGADVQYPLGPEWELAQEELCKILNCTSPIDMLGCVRAAVRMVALSCEASRKRKGKKGAIGADDILPALTWIVVQANPPELASRLWFMSYYMSTEAGMSEAGYCLTQLSSVIDFVQTIKDASVLTDISTEEYNAGVGAHSLTQEGIHAAKARDLERVDALVAAGARYDQLGSNSQHTILTAAVVSGNNEMVEAILKYHSQREDQVPSSPRSRGANLGSFLSKVRQDHKRADLNVRVSPHFGENSGKTALHFAAQSGNLQAVLALLREGARREVRDRQGLTPLHLAAEAKQDKVVTVLLADPTKTSLHEAARIGDHEVVWALLMQGCDPNSLDPTGEHTPLIVAAYNGWLALLEMLLVCANHEEMTAASTTLINADPNVTNNRGETALMYCVQGFGASSQSQVQVAVALLKAGADRYMKDKKGQTALDWAMKFGCQELQRILKTDPMHHTIYQAARERDTLVLEALLAQDVDPNVQCPQDGYTALVATVYNGDVELTKILVSHSATDVNARDQRDMTPLMWAAKNGDEEMVLLLLRHGADRWLHLGYGMLSASDLAHQAGFPDLSVLLQHDPSKESICIVAWENNWPGVQALVKQGVSINSRHRVHNSEGWHHERYTPLIAACASGHVELVTKLLTIPEVDVNLPNLLGQTPLMYSAALGSEGLVLLLLKMGANRYLVDIDKKGALDWSMDRYGPVAKILMVDPAKRSIQLAAASGKKDEVKALIKQGVSANATKSLTLRSIMEKLKLSHAAKKEEPKKSSHNSAQECKEDSEMPFLPPENVIDEGFDATPLTLACCFNQTKTVKYLLRRPEVQVDFRDLEGRTALMHAARCGAEPCVLALIDRTLGNSNRHQKDRRGRETASDFAIRAGFLHIAAIIQAEPERLPICYAAALGRVALVSGLLKQGVSANTVDTDQRLPYQTPLIAAARSNRLPMVKFLLRLPDIEIDQPNSAGETALMHATAVGALGIAKLLMAHGASPRLPDQRGLTAEHWAFRKGYINMLQFKFALCAFPGHD